VDKVLDVTTVEHEGTKRQTARVSVLSRWPNSTQNIDFQKIKIL